MARYGSVARRQTLVQLDDARIAALDQRALASGRSRSDLIREAVDLLLGGGEEGAVDAAIAAGYRRQPASETDAWAIGSALAAIRDEPW
jgi:Ribbon-helix-helix protein, copG family